MAHIDADKLIAEIERWRDKAKEKYNKNPYCMGRCDALAEFRNHIVSLLEEQPEFVNKIWHKVSEEANLTRPVVLSDGDKYMSPPCTFPFKDMSGFVNAMNKRYKADYTIWAYMDDLLNISSLQQEQPSLPSGLDDAAEKYSENILANNEDLQDAIEDAFKAGAEWYDNQMKMPNSSELISAWRGVKSILQEKDFRGDEWRLAFNAFMFGFSKGLNTRTKKK